MLKRTISIILLLLCGVNLFAGEPKWRAHAVAHNYEITENMPPFRLFHQQRASDTSLIALAFPFIAISKDKGIHWNILCEVPSYSNTARNDYIFSSEEKIYIAADSTSVFSRKYGMIIYTHDAGENWNKIKLDSHTTVTKISMKKEDLGFALVKTVASNSF